MTPPTAHCVEQRNLVPVLPVWLFLDHPCTHSCTLFSLYYKPRLSSFFAQLVEACAKEGEGLEKFALDRISLVNYYTCTCKLELELRANILSAGLVTHAQLDLQPRKSLINESAQYDLLDQWKNLSGAKFAEPLPWWRGSSRQTKGDYIYL